jgi:2-dehydro-3-deoxyphosphooctonate aldolase (KDO 8-P synthase)
LQIPAFLIRQTDMVAAGALAAVKHKRILNAKKAQFMAPTDMGNVVDKCLSCNLSKNQIWLTERGVSFGYNNLVVDMASFHMMAPLGVRTIFDVTHSVQRPGGDGKITGGKRDQAFVLAKAAVAAGAQGIFMETHPIPDQALSDKTTCLPLAQIPKIVDRLLELYNLVLSWD